MWNCRKYFQCIQFDFCNQFNGGTIFAQMIEKTNRNDRGKPKLEKENAQLMVRKNEIKRKQVEKEWHI